MTAKQKILVIEDDKAIRRGVVDALVYFGYEVDEAAEADTGKEKALQGKADLLLLDLVLPGGDGLDILKALRAEHPSLPVIILTARGEEKDRVKGLDLGADDYVVKPFSVRELMARVEAVLRRSASSQEPPLVVPFQGGTIHLGPGRIQYDDGRTCELSGKECSLLSYLVENAGRVVSRDEVLSRVWRVNLSGGETRTVDMTVARLREKVGDDASDPTFIKTVRGRGYLFEESEA